MKFIRWLVAILVLIYVAWISWPVVRDIVMPPPDEPFVASRQADDMDYSTGYGNPTLSAGPTPEEASQSIQGQTAVEAIQTGNMPVITLWGAVVALYLIAAFLFANGNLRAAFAYGSAFIADVVLTFITKGQAGSGLFDKILEILSGWDPRYTITLVALVLGFIMFLARSKPVNRRPF